MPEASREVEALSSRGDAGEVIRRGLTPVAMRSLEQGRRPGRGSWAGWAGSVAGWAEAQVGQGGFCFILSFCFVFPFSSFCFYFSVLFYFRYTLFLA